MAESDKPLLITRVESLAAARREANGLVAENGNLFATFEWGDAWLRHLRRGSSPEVALLARTDGAVVGQIALVVTRERSLRVARLLGHGPADRLAPVCRPGDRQAVAEALIRHLAATGCDLFVGQQMPGDEGWGAALGAEVVSTEPSPVVTIGGVDWDGFLARRSSNFRQQVRRRERKLAKLGELRFRLSDDLPAVDADLETLFALHEERWGGASSAFAGPLRGFHRQFAHAAFARGWLRLWVLELDRRPLAAWYGFRYAGAEWYYQSGRALDFKAENVGSVLLAHTLREAISEGCHEYRLLRGGEEYKARFADTDPGLETIALATSARGRAALSARRMAKRGAGALRRLGLR